MNNINNYITNSNNSVCLIIFSSLSSFFLAWVFRFAFFLLFYFIATTICINVYGIYMYIIDFFLICNLYEGLCFTYIICLAIVSTMKLFGKPFCGGS